MPKVPTTGWGKGDADRTTDKNAYRDNYDRIHKAGAPIRCVCNDPPVYDADGCEVERYCGVHQCPYCDGTGTRFNDEPCDHKPISRRF